MIPTKADRVLPFTHQNNNTTSSTYLGWPLLGSFVIHAVLLGIIVLSVEDTGITEKSRQLTVQIEKSIHANNVAANVAHAIKPTMPPKQATEAPVATHAESIDRQQLPIAAIEETPVVANTQSTTNTKTAMGTASESTTTVNSATSKLSTIPDEQAPQFDAAFLKNPQPSYPLFAKKRQQQGTVMLKVKVSIEGKAEVVELAKSSGFSLLDDAAQQTVEKWLFVPAHRGDLVIASSVIVPIRFALR